MNLADVPRDAILAAIAEYDRLGEEQFLITYDRGQVWVPRHAGGMRLVHSAP